MPIRGDVLVEGGGLHGLTAQLFRLDVPDRACRKLHNCRLSKLRGRHLLIEGVEDVTNDQGAMRHQQIWWCRQPRDGSTAAPFDPHPPSAVRHDPSYGASPFRVPTSVG